MLWTQLARLTLLIDVAVTLTSTDNEVYSGCGFEPVQGQAHMFKFCNAYGQCIKTSCGANRVFSKSDCGCIPSIKISITELSSVPYSTIKNVYPNKNTDLRSTSLTDSFSSVLKATDRLVNVVVLEKDQLPVQRTPVTDRAYPLPSNLTAATPPAFVAVDNSKSVLAAQLGSSGIPGYSASENFNEPISVRSHQQNSAVHDTHIPSVEPKNNFTDAVTQQISVSKNSQQSARVENVQQNLSVVNGPFVNYSFDLSEIPRSALSETSTLKVTTTNNYQSEIPAAIAASRGDVMSADTAAGPITRNATRTEGYQDLTDSGAVTTAPNWTTALMGTGQIMCGAEVNITGMSDRNLLTGDTGLGTVYIGVRGVKSSAGERIHFNGSGFLWIPLYESMRFTSGLTISMEIKEDATFQVRQGIAGNCGNNVTPSFSIVLDPKAKQITFKAVVVATDTPVPIQETLQVSIPYEPGAAKAIEMQCNGHKLIGRVGGHVTGTHIPSTETYRLASRPKPIYIGKGCLEEQTENFYGNITSVGIYRCVRSDIGLI